MLLKNEGSVLPIRSGARVLVAGHADDIGQASGGWTLTWQGTGNSNADFPNGQSIWGGIREAVAAGGGQATLSADGAFTQKPDVAIVVFGETPYAEFQGDVDTLDFLPFIDSMDAVAAANSGHSGMPMGMADVATVLWRKHLKFDASAPNWFDRDRFILSAGHGSMLIYSLLHLTGFEQMTLDQIRNFRQWGAITAGHPEYGHATGIETTTGPLGQGFANAVGMALAGTVVTLLLGLPTAFVLYRLAFPMRGLARSWVVMPFVLPTVVVGVMFRSLLAPGGPLGFLGWDGTPWAIGAAFVFFNLAVVVRTVGGVWAVIVALASGNLVLLALHWPLLGAIRPCTTRSKVLLPEPLPPISATLSPGAMRSTTPCSACTAP